MRLTTLALLFVAVAPAAAATVVAPPSAPNKIDPNVLRTIETGQVGPPPHRPVAPGRAHVIVELSAEVTDADLVALQNSGALLVPGADGTLLHYHRFVPAFVDRAAAVAVAALPGVVRVSSAGGRGPMPLDRSAQLIRLADARGSRPPLDELTGKGTLIGDNDSMVDPFHPTFFKGDGGYFDWIDVNHNKVFDVGVDAIDLNRNGVADKGETAQLLSAATVDEFDAPVPSARSTGFDPGIDWLYLDSNGNGQRDYGAANGFTDATPAFGEPLFVPDDVNRSGTLDPGERVVRLSTSKFKAISVTLDQSDLPMASDLYTRGTNLSSTKVNYTNGAAVGFADALHATGVNTILVGDVPLVGRRWVGIAPEADVVLAWEEANDLPVEATMWLLNQKPDVMLYEMASWTYYPVDGSDAHSQIINTATTSDNITNICPTGDQGSAHKHGAAQVAAGATVSLPFNLPAHALGLTAPLQTVWMSLDIRGGSAATLSVTDPGGNSYDITSTTAASTGTVMTGASYYSTRETTPAATDFVNFQVYTGAPPDPALDVGTWNVNVTAGATALSVDAYVADDQSSWGVGAAWDASVSTDRATVGIPSVADHCIAVNAIPDHLPTDNTQTYYEMDYWDYDVPAGYADAVGQIRAYTPLGPRIDGVIKPDVCAPDNPWVATQHDSQSTTAYGSFRLFGGTSGASPHVTAAAALLAQTGLRGDAARDALRMGADHDSITGAVPNGSYGYGRLDIAAALGVTTAGQDFAAALTASPTVYKVGAAVTLTATATATGSSTATSGIEAKWDDLYDGTWDTAYAATTARTVTATATWTPYKVRLRNGAGHVAEAVFWVGPQSASASGPTRAAASGCGCTVGAPVDHAARSAGLLFALLWLTVLVRRRRQEVK